MASNKVLKVNNLTLRYRPITVIFHSALGLWKITDEDKGKNWSWQHTNIHVLSAGYMSCVAMLLRFQ